MSTLFADIRAAASKGASSGAAEYAAPIDFDGTLTEPSPGYIVPVEPATKNLYGYQRRAIETILTSNLRGYVCAFLPGLGKTAVSQAVAAARVAQGDRVLVVVPPTLLISPWLIEFGEDYPGLRVSIVTGKKAGPFPADADVVLISDAIIADREDDALAWAPTVLIGDEAHRYKNVQAARAKAVRAIADRVPEDGIVLMLTGTLADNTIADVWHPVRIAGQRTATALSGGPGYKAFQSRWCEVEHLSVNGRTVTKTIGCTDPRGLRNRLTSTSMLSVDPSIVLDLPERQWVVRNLEVSGPLVADYLRAEDDLLRFIRETKDDAAAKRAAKAEAIVLLGTLWRLDGIATAPATAAYVIDSLLSQGEPVVLWAHHTDVIGKLWDALYPHARLGSIIGGMTSAAKAEVVERFQSGDLDVIIGNMTAGGTGVTLTRACHSVHAQLTFSPGTYQQSCARIHRIGQNRPVTYHTMVMGSPLGSTPVGVSHRLWGVLRDKAAVNDVVNADAPVTIDESSVTETILRDMGW